MRVKLQLFPMEEFQLINVEGIRKTENGQNTTILVQASKINQQMLKLVGESLNRNMVFISSHLQWRNPADAIDTKWPRLMLPLVPINVIWYALRKAHHLCSIFPKYGFSIITRKQQISQNWRLFYKITHQYSSKVLRSWKTRKNCEELFQMAGDEGDMSVTVMRESELDPGKAKGHSWKNCWNLNKVCTSVNSTAPRFMA